MTRGSKSTARQVIGTLSTLVVGSTRPIVSRPDLLGAHKGVSSYKKAGAVNLLRAGLGPFQCRVRVRGDRNLRSVSAGPPGPSRPGDSAAVLGRSRTWSGSRT